MALITDEEIEILNAARKALRDISARATTHLPEEENYRDLLIRSYGRLAEQAEIAGGQVFGTLNIARSHCGVQISHEQMHPPGQYE